MADYYPLLTRALEALPDRSGDTRRTVYDRARSALVGQLRSLDPPLSDADIARERKALEEAIGRIETEHGGSAAEMAAAEIEAPPPAPAEADEEKRAQEKPAARPWKATVRKARGPVPDGRDETKDAPAAAPTPARDRPRIDTVAAQPGLDPARRRSLILGTVLLLLVTAVAVTAWLLRDRPGELPPNALAEAGAAGEGQGKLADRVGGERAAPVATGATGGSAAQGRPDLAVAQRAIFVEENPADGQAPRSPVSGRAVWRLDAVNAGQGQPLETVVRGQVEVPEAGLTLALTIRRNLDPTLPASHTIELAFTTTGNDNRAVRDVGLIQLKSDESVRGTPVAGLPVPVKDNLFLIGLSNLKGDVERNAELLLNRNWLDIPLRFNTGKRAFLSFEKGVPGDRVLNDAFGQWR